MKRRGKDTVVEVVMVDGFSEKPQTPEQIRSQSLDQAEQRESSRK